MTLPARFLAALLPALWLAACAHQHGTKKTDVAGAASTEATKGFRIKSGVGGDDDFGKIANKYGSINKVYDPNGNNKVAPGFSKEDKNFAGKNFDTKKFQTKSFWGDKEYATKVYGGNTDGSRFMKDSKFGDKSASEGGKAAKDADRQFATSDYAGYSGKTAHETTKADIANKNYAEVDHRRKVGNAFSDPDVIDWKEQRQMNVEQTKSLLGH